MSNTDKAIAQILASTFYSYVEEPESDSYELRIIHHDNHLQMDFTIKFEQTGRKLEAVGVDDIEIYWNNEYCELNDKDLQDVTIHLESNILGLMLSRDNYDVESENGY